MPYRAPQRGRRATGSRNLPARAIRSLFHRAILCIRVAVVREHLFDNLRLVPSVGPFADFRKIEVLDRVVVVVKFESPTHRREVGVLECDAKGVRVSEVVFGSVKGAIDQYCAAS